MKEFLKSVNIWRRYGQKYGGMFFFDSQCSIPTKCVLDDSVAELAECSCCRITLHADAVGDIGIKMRQDGMSHTGAEHHLTLVVDLLIVEWPVVDVETFYCPLVRVRLLQQTNHSSLVYKKLTSSLAPASAKMTLLNNTILLYYINIISKTGATRCQIVRLKCTKFDFRWGSTPDTAGELTALPTPR